MAEIGFDITVEGLRSYISKQGYALVECSFKAYRRQLENWWPDTLLIRYNALAKEGNDDARKACLVRYLSNPLSGGFAADTLSEMPGERGEGGCRLAD